jgi:hypothetical protein
VTRTGHCTASYTIVMPRATIELISKRHTYANNILHNHYYFYNYYYYYYYYYYSYFHHYHHHMKVYNIYMYIYILENGCFVSTESYSCVADCIFRVIRKLLLQTAAYCVYYIIEQYTFFFLYTCTCNLFKLFPKSKI